MLNSHLCMRTIHCDTNALYAHCSLCCYLLRLSHGHDVESLVEALLAGAVLLCLLQLGLHHDLKVRRDLRNRQLRG